MSSHRYRRGAWVLAAALILAVVLFAYDGKPNSDVGQLLLGAMVLIAFPAALMGAAAIGAAYAIAELCCGVVVKTSYFSPLIEWLVLAASGYLQWFVFMPWASRRWAARKAKMHRETASP